ncbi:MAG: DUF3820 family protein [Flavobacteriaceae bacterium]|nr:DUF3820 family protein [Flavobacteriaceae bacterium]MDZ4148310.1 DUF3820 family protein [Flavobacteriaceae bacterium]
MSENTDNRKELLELAQAKMPFGKYKNRFLIDLPEYYVVWYKNKGWPAGKLGKQLQLVYEIKLNGLEDLIRKLR